jgi:hypothetical protein
MGDASAPWRNWYHCMGNTYGTWLPGDSRGFRARHHREHVEGDYKFPPPPGVYEAWLARSRSLMPRGAVMIPAALRPLACRLFGDALLFHGVELVELSMGGIHWHLLARFVPVGVDPHAHLTARGIKLTHAPRHGRPPAPAGRTPSRWSAYDLDPAPRRILGLAKSFVSRQLKDQGHFTSHRGGIWAVRAQCVPIANRPHQLAVAAYIRCHAEQGSAMWTRRVEPEK